LRKEVVSGTHMAGSKRSTSKEKIAIHRNIRRMADAFLKRMPKWLHFVEVQMFMKYCLVGMINTGISYAVYAFFVAVHVPISISLAFGYVSGLISSYSINARWTFAATTPIQWKHRWRFIIANILLLLLSEQSLQWIVKHAVASPYIAQVLNLIPITILGFLVNRWVFLNR